MICFCLLTIKRNKNDTSIKFTPISVDSDFIDRDGEGKAIFDTRQLPSPLVFSATMWKDPEAPHSVENLSKIITIKIYQD